MIFWNFGESMFICLIIPCFTVKLLNVIANLVQNGFPYEKTIKNKNG